MFIYTLPRTPGATITTPWETFCHSKSPFVVIGHDEWRNTSRWQGVKRKRCFYVQYHARKKYRYFHGERSWYSTLAQAESAAAKLVAEKTAAWSAAQDDGWHGRLRKEER